MDNIEYIEEETKEEIYTGTYLLDGIPISPEQQRQKILEEVAKAGIEIDKEDEIEINYDGVEDSESETQETRYTVFRVKKEKVPYRVNREEIVHGSYIMDGIPLTEEEQRQRILSEMRNSGIEIENEEEIQINYDGVEDSESETQETRYTVFRVTKEKVDISEEEKVEDENLDDLQRELARLKILRDKIASSTNIEERRNLIDQIYNRTDEMAEEIGESREISDAFSSELRALDGQINALQKELKQAATEYEDSYNRMRAIIDEQKEKLGTNNLLTEEEISAIEDEANKKKLEENENSISIKKQIEDQQKLLTALKRRRNKLERDIKTATALGLSLNELKEIQSTLQKTKIMDAILTKVGLEEIITKPSKERTEEEKEKLKKAKEEILTKVGEAKSENQSSSILDIIEGLYSIQIQYRKEKSPRVLLIPEKQFLRIEDKSRSIPEKIATEAKINNYVPGKAPEDLKEIIEEKKPEKIEKKEEDISEKITIYHDKDNDLYFVKKYALFRFNILDVEDVKNIDGFLCGQIPLDAVEKIKSAQNNSYSPFQVVEKEISLENEEEKEEKITPKEKEQITIYKDEAKNDHYLNLENMKRFNLTSNDKIVRIDGLECQKIKEENVNWIENNKNTLTEPYDVVYKKIEQQKQAVPTQGEVVANESHEPQNGFEIPTTFLKPNNLEEEQEQIAPKEEENKENKDEIQNKSFEEPVSVKPHVETIIYKLTKDLDIRANDAKRYTAKNLQPSKQFVKELHSGNWAYNIVHLVPSIGKAAFAFLNKMAGSILTTPRGLEAMQKLERRLNNLSEEEVQILFDEYKGSQLKTDMNNQINSIILGRVRRHGLEKVEELNNKIKKNYTELFSIMGELKPLEENIAKEGISRKSKDAYYDEIQRLMAEAAPLVKDILEERKEANNLLSSGVHGLEEDFKAVQTKLSYVGMRFAKKNDFNNELQEKLSQYGERLNNAIAHDNNEQIVSNFMALESCYYNHTNIRASIVGSRSVGEKYYSPLAEQFDYRDDPFIRDLFTTVALTSATVSAVNSIRVHEIEARDVLREQQKEINQVNNANDKIMSDVGQIGKEIEGKRDTFQEGIETQIHEDVLSNANMLEREALDMHQWTFTDAYHATDAANHEFYNQFHQDITNELQNITSRYGTGSINQAQALQEIGDVARVSQQYLVEVANESIGILKQYANSHPEFNLSAIQESMEYLTSHPQAISQMNQEMINATNLASGLQGLSVEHATALSSLPSDMLSTLVCAATAAGLATKVSKDMEDKYRNKYGYGNEITDMMDDYVSEEETVKRR